MDTHEREENNRDDASDPYYPPKCLKYGHDHSGRREGNWWIAHTDQCKNSGGLLWLRRCEHMQTHEEAILEANGGKWPEPPPAPPKELHVYHHDAPTIKQGQTITLTIPGIFDKQQVKVVNVTKSGSAHDLELEAL